MWISTRGRVDFHPLSFLCKYSIIFWDGALLNLEYLAMCSSSPAGRPSACGIYMKGMRHQQGQKQHELQYPAKIVQLRDT
jgi:hypothetical protein